MNMIIIIHMHITYLGKLCPERISAQHSEKHNKGPFVERKPGIAGGSQLGDL